MYFLVNFMTMIWILSIILKLSLSVFTIDFPLAHSYEGKMARDFSFDNLLPINSQFYIGTFEDISRSGCVMQCIMHSSLCISLLFNDGLNSCKLLNCHLNESLVDTNQVFGGWEFWILNKGLTLEDEMGPLDCPDGWFRYENHCYYVNTTAVTWNEAKFQCEINGARLIEIESDSENTWVMETFLPPWTNAECSKWWDCCDCWIGATDIDTEGVFTWNHVTNITYSNWYIDQPDNLQMGHCVIMCRNGFWDDLDCARMHTFICEKL